MFIVPVDLPLVEPEVFQALAGRHGHSRAPIVVPVHQGRRGHPILLDTAVLRGVDMLRPDEPLRDFIHAYGKRVEEVPVASPSVLMDLNTPEDVQRAQAWLDEKRRTRILETRKRARGK